MKTTFLSLFKLLKKKYWRIYVHLYVCICMNECFCFVSIKTLNEQMHIWRCMTIYVKSYVALLSGKAHVLQLDLEQLWNYGIACYQSNKFLNTHEHVLSHSMKLQYIIQSLKSCMGNKKHQKVNIILLAKLCTYNIHFKQYCLLGCYAT
jgi:hypothetical protein